MEYWNLFAKEWRASNPPFLPLQSLHCQWTTDEAVRCHWESAMSVCHPKGSTWSKITRIIESAKSFYYYKLIEVIMVLEVIWNLHNHTCSTNEINLFWLLMISNDSSMWFLYGAHSFNEELQLIILMPKFSHPLLLSSKADFVWSISKVLVTELLSVDAPGMGRNCSSSGDKSSCSLTRSSWGLCPPLLRRSTREGGGSVISSAVGFVWPYMGSLRGDLKKCSWARVRWRRSMAGVSRATKAAPLNKLFSSCNFESINIMIACNIYRKLSSN